MAADPRTTGREGLPGDGRPEGLEALVVRCLGDGVLVIDAEGLCRSLNPRGEAYLGVAADEIFGMPASTATELVLERTGAEDAASWRELVEREMGDPDEESTSFVTVRRPEPRMLNRLSLPLRGEDGRVRGRLMVFHDVTGHHRGEEVRDKLIAGISHELRTPLTSIKGALNLVHESREGGSVDALLAIAERNCERLSRVVDSILDLARFRAGKMRLAWERLDLADLAEAVVGVSAEAAARWGVMLSAEVPRGRFHLRGDRRRLQQVLVNFLDNALRHAPAGSTVRLDAVEVGPHEEGPGSDSPWIRVSVSDAGPGIRPDDLERIFEPFYQAQEGFAKRGGGPGLGLALCRSIIEEHRGRIWCESRPGEGSRFLFELQADAPGKGRGGKEEPGEDFPVLVVDDDTDLVEIISLALRRAGYRPVKAFDGAHALAAAEEQSLRAVILDIRMPGMSGYEVLRRLREDPRHREVPVVMLTASGEEGRKLAGELGAWAYLTKPFEEKHLLRELEDIRRETRA